MINKKKREFFSCYPVVVFSTNDKIISEDEAFPPVFYIESGHVAQLDISLDGQNMQLNLFRERAFFPMAPHLSAIKNKYFFIARGRVVARKIPPNDVMQFLRTNPDVLLDLTQRLYVGIDGLLTRMSMLLTGDARARVVAELVIAADRFHKSDNAKFAYKVTHQQIAEQTGLSRETVSRILKQLEGEDLLSLKRLSVIISVDKLRNEYQDREN